MVQYNCKFCNYSTSYKNTLFNHIKRKNKCDVKNIYSKDDEIKEDLHYTVSYNKHNTEYTITENNRFKCNLCGKTCKYQNYIYTHIKNCKAKIENISLNCDKLKEGINCDTYIKKQNIYNQNTYNQNQFNQNNYNISLLQYGKENLNYINKSLIEEMINEYRKFGSDADIIRNFCKLVHFNDDHPENKNIEIIDLDEKTRETIVKIFTGEWVLIKSRDLAERMAGEKIDQLNEHADKNNLSLMHHSILNTYLDQYSYFRTKDLENSLNYLLFQEAKAKKENKIKDI